MSPASLPSSGESVPVMLDDVEHEGVRLASAAVAARMPIRLMGGLAIWHLAPSVRAEPYRREYRDMDFAAASKAGRTKVGDFFVGQGYVPEKLFNAIHGAQRLNFAAPHGRWTIDVVFDELNMSHQIDLRGRLDGAGLTIDPADLLLTKLQVWEINSKDLGDVACLLADLPLIEDGGAGIDLRRVRSLTGSDWGLCHTVERNLRSVAELAGRQPPTGGAHDAAAQAAALLHAIEHAPKSLSWKARARVGERVRWYEVPEEVRHQV